MPSSLTKSYTGVCFDLSDLVLQFLFRPICQENGPRLHTAGIYMADTVFLLIRSGIFMLLITLFR